MNKVYANKVWIQVLNYNYQQMINWLLTKKTNKDKILTLTLTLTLALIGQSNIINSTTKCLIN